MTEPAVTQPIQITEAGVYDIPADVYHADPVPEGSLSSSGARKLLPPSCPALYRYERDHPPTSTSTFDFGKAAHKLVLGAGECIVKVEADDWRTNAAKAIRDQAYTEGRIPLLAKDYQAVEDMAAALLAHPLASWLFDPDSGKPEQSLFFPDQVAVTMPDGQTGTITVWRRCRLDWLPDLGDGSGRYILPEYKTCASADPEALMKAFGQFWYPMQSAWNLDLIEDLGIAGKPRMVFVCQEKTPPYLVTIVEPDAIAMRAARTRNREALRIYAQCTYDDRWPSYAEDVIPLPLPAWIEREYV